MKLDLKVLQRKSLHGEVFSETVMFDPSILFFPHRFTTV